jgi:hypothetical protein
MYVNSPKRACSAAGARVCLGHEYGVALHGSEFLPSRTGRFTPRKKPRSPVGRPHSGPDVSKKIKISSCCRDSNPEPCSP